MRNEKCCGAVVFRKNADQYQFLLIKHKLYNENNYWNHPKGHVEQGETEQQTALREIKEETGLDVTIVKGFREIDHYRFPSSFDHEIIDKTVIYFLAEAVSDDLKLCPQEIADCRWLNYQAANDTLSYPGSKKILRTAWDFLQQ